MIYHQLTGYSKNQWYRNKDIDDLLTIEATTGNFNDNCNMPPLLAQATSWSRGKGFSKVWLSPDRNEDTVLLHEMKTSLGKTMYVQGSECMNIENLFKDRIVIFPVCQLYAKLLQHSNNNLETLLANNKGTMDVYFNHPSLEQSKLIMLPVWLEANKHFTFFVLDRRNKEQTKGYYFDPFGKNNPLFEQYCKNKGYSYKYNDKCFQWDGHSCGPRIVEFASHVMNCIRDIKNKEITTDGMPEFSRDQAFKRHKELLSSLLYTPSLRKADLCNEVIISAADYIRKNFPKIEIPKIEAPTQYNEETPSNNKVDYIPIIAASIAAAVGGTVGYTVNQFTNIKQILGITGKPTNLIFDISFPLICAAILGTISYGVANSLSNSRK